MIKLTDQQIRDAVNGAGLTFTHPDLTVGRAVEAEVLRLNGWQPIETAPKDSAIDVLLKIPGRVQVVAAWHRGGWAPMDLDGHHVGGKPTHWMPLPADPSDHSVDAGNMVSFPTVEDLRRQMREVTEAAYKMPGKAVRMPDLVVIEGRKFMRGEPSLFDELTFGEVQLIGVDLASESPRATGCPETMDDTGNFAEVDMPAFLRKQNPA